MKQRYWLPFVLAAVFAGGMWVGWLQNHDRTFQSKAEAKLISVLRLIENNYVDEVSLDSLVELALPALLENLDPHSSYIPASELASVNSELEGSFSGIGISFQILNDTLKIVEVIPGGPSEKAGVMPGDCIVKVDDRDIAGTQITENDVFSLLRGEKGTSVQITVKRRHVNEPMVFDLVRDDIPVESIDAAYMLDDDTGYVKVARFGRTTYDEFMQALNKLRLQGAINYVVDLRSNGGGYMQPAVLMANEFLDPGLLIVSTRGRNSSDDDVIVSDGTGAYRNSGLSVIIDEGTASASEIFSGAIQDNDRGWIIGRRSFGKGLVQRPFDLPDSSEIRLTWQRYYTPSGRSIQKEFKPGENEEYFNEVYNRIISGEILSADSVSFDPDKLFKTIGGRSVYGGGGIMPDFFVPEDTSHFTTYLSTVMNRGLIRKFSQEYAELNRETLEVAQNVDELLALVPSDVTLLRSFAYYASQQGVPQRWYYINLSAPVIVNYLKALIAQNILGRTAFYQIYNSMDDNVSEALRHIYIPLDTPALEWLNSLGAEDEQ